MTNRDKLNAMFRLLRRQDLVARQGFLCCGGCAAAAAGEMAEARGLRGAVFYHKQDSEDLARGADRLFLKYGATKGGDKEANVEIARVVVWAANQIGFDVEWGGDTHKCIEVLLPGGIDAESRPSLCWLRAFAQATDDHLSAVLAAEYGPERAGDARYWHDALHPAPVRAAIAAKVAADRSVSERIEEDARCAG